MASLLISVYLIAAAIAAVAAALILRRRTVRGGVWLALFLASAAYWAFFDALELTGSTVESWRIFAQFQYLGVVLTAPTFFHTCFALARLRRPRALLAFVWSVPLVTLLIAWTSGWHTWLWRSIELDSARGVAVFNYGPWFWVFMAHSYVVLVVAMAVLISAARRVSSPFRAPLWFMVGAVSLPWLGNAAYNFKLGPPALEGVDWGALGLVAMGVLIARAVWWEGLLDVFPRVWETLLDGLSDGVIVLRDGKTSFANPAARRILGVADGRPIPPETLRRLGAITGSAGSTEVQLPGEPPTWVEVRSDAVKDRWGEAGGHLIMVRDVSSRKALEGERERLISDLTGALAEVHTLQDLLPVCAWCNKVRDDRGYWEGLDRYLGKRMRMSHGMCPDCHTKLVGDAAGSAGEAGGG
jgi:PAS domain-containing protein